MFWDWMCTLCNLEVKIATVKWLTFLHVAIFKACVGRVANIYNFENSYSLGEVVQYKLSLSDGGSHFFTLSLIEEKHVSVVYELKVK